MPAKILKEDGTPANRKRSQNQVASTSTPTTITTTIATNETRWVAQERQWQNERQSSDLTVALVERDQRLSALKAECDWVTSQLAEERKHREALEPELDLARGGWTAAEKRAAEFEASFKQTSLRLQQAEISVTELTDQLDIVKSERSDAVLELAHNRETVTELNLQLEKARADRADVEQILGRARAELDRTSIQLGTAETTIERATAECEDLKKNLSKTQAELNAAVKERDKLQTLIGEDHDLAEYAEAKADRDRLEVELRDTQSRLEGFVEKIEELSNERESLKRERTELQLRVAALRDAHDDTQLQQDNEVLRRMVERLNEELKEFQPELAKRKRRAAPGGIVGGLARAAISRCFVPDADAAEGR